MLLPTWRFGCVRRTLRSASKFRDVPGLRQSALAMPLHTLPAPLEHGALGVWDEVVVGALLVGCAVAYMVWFYLSGRKDERQRNKD